jgi:hypothetical protein
MLCSLIEDRLGGYVDSILILTEHVSWGSVTEIPISVRRDPTHTSSLVVDAIAFGFNIGSRPY